MNLGYPPVAAKPDATTNHRNEGSAHTRVGPEPEFASWAAIWRSGFPEALESRARNSRRRL